MKLMYITLIMLLCLGARVQSNEIQESRQLDNDPTGVSLIVLGTIQDAGSPHIGCKKACCASLFLHPPSDRRVVSLGLIDRSSGKRYLIEATPDISTQLNKLQKHPDGTSDRPIDGIFITHAHIGHYTGLMYLGKEALGAKNIPVYVMPRMESFLKSNGPWSQLISEENIHLFSLTKENQIQLSSDLKITPIQVPHRDEYSETVGFIVNGPNKSILFIPDIDKWEKWDRNIEDEIKKVDYAFIDATFYSAEEIGHRDISMIPHPLMTESMERLGALNPEEKSKVHFIHFNHTNPVLQRNSLEALKVKNAGFRLAQIHSKFEL